MKSCIKWVGGKSRSVNKILPLFPTHKKYVEVFGGAGWLLFGKEPSSIEVFNDFDSNLMNFWNVVRDYPTEFIESFDWMLVSREIFNQYKEIYKEGIYKDEIHQAHTFYYLVQSGFGADMKYPSFGTGKDRNRLRLENIEKDILKATERLKDVKLMNSSFEKVFETYDSEETFFFIDSPYRNTKEYAVGKFEDKQYELLFDYCKNAKGKWLYTINDDDFIRELFKDFNIRTNEVPYSISNAKRKKTGELIITNF